MRRGVILIMALTAGWVAAQQGQQGSRPGWPCVAGRAVDSAYIDISESTGGQLFLFQKGEMGQSAIVMGAQFSHPATILRGVGILQGSRDFDFPVDSSVESILVLASLQCRNAILVSRPNGAELTAANSAKSVDLQAGKILQVDSPEAGMWRVRMTGTGLFVVSVLAKSALRLGSVEFHEGDGPKLSNPLFGVKQWRGSACFRTCLRGSRCADRCRGRPVAGERAGGDDCGRRLPDGRYSTGRAIPGCGHRYGRGGAAFPENPPRAVSCRSSRVERYEISISWSKGVYPQRYTRVPGSGGSEPRTWV